MQPRYVTKMLIAGSSRKTTVMNASVRTDIVLSVFKMGIAKILFVKINV